MTVRDVLISRVHDGLGQPMSLSPLDRTPGVEALWAVTAAGQTPQTLHPFTQALDVALTWAGESGGEIYRRDQPGAEPSLYKGAW
jgi:hypothetical protein